MPIEIHGKNWWVFFVVTGILGGFRICKYIIIQFYRYQPPDCQPVYYGGLRVERMPYYYLSPIQKLPEMTPRSAK